MLLQDFSLNDIEVLDSYSVGISQKVVDFIGKYDPDRLLYNFRVAAGLNKSLNVFGPYPGWENAKIGGHTMGHYLAACAQGVSHGFAACKGKDGRTLEERLKYLIEELDKCQKNYPKANGFIFGALLDDGEDAECQFDRLDSGDPKNTWVPWYTMHKILAGLLEVYKLTSNHKSLEIAQKLGEWVYNRVSKWSETQKYKVLETEYGGMNDCLYELYKCSKEDGYKDFEHFAIAAHAFDEEKLFEEVFSGKKNCLNNRHANTTIPKFIGALNRYRALGEEKYLEYAKAFWELLIHHHTYITGGNSESEFFGPDDVLDYQRSNSNCETCNTHNMLKFTRELFKITGEKKYADYYDQTYQNAILASVNNESGMTTYFQPMATGCFKVYCNPDLEKNYFWCCTGTGLENFTKLGDSFYFHNQNQLYVNIYQSSKIQWKEKGLVLYQSCDLEKAGQVCFEIKEADGQEFEILFRRPDWAASFEIEDSKGQKISVSEKQDYLGLKNKWKTGDKVTVNMTYKLKAFNLPDNSCVFGLKYGPYVLAAELGKDENMTLRQIGVNCDVAGNKIVNKQRQDLMGSYLNTRGIGTLKDEKLLVDFSAKDFMENPGKYLEKEDSKVSFYLSAKNWPEKLHFIPYFKLHNQRYGIYWII